MKNEWAKMGCAGQPSELNCMKNVYGNNRAAGNAAFAAHWGRWITPDTVQDVFDAGLNTIRIPIGYWSLDSIVNTATEPFADGNLMLPFLDAVVQKASDLGIFVIMDLHGAPGAQQQDPFTGQDANPAGFFNNNNFARAEKWLAWMTNRIHTNPAYASVGIIEVLNEPVSAHDGARFPAPGEASGLTQVYYPAALKAVRDAEAALGISGSRALHVEFMSSKWGSGNPRASAAVANDPNTAFDDHNYIGFALGGSSDQAALMKSACTDSRLVSGQNVTITGEWSMTSGVAASDTTFFKKWFTAQQQLYEKPGMAGWVFWTWKTELNDPRWTYSVAADQGLVPTTASGLEQNVFQQVC